MEKFIEISIKEMRDQISNYCEIEGFMKDAEAAYIMPDEEVADCFNSIFDPTPMVVKEGKFEF